MSNGYNHNSYHDSHCDGSYCNCDDRRYGHYSSGSGIGGAICIILAILVSLVCPPLGFIIFYA